MSPCFMALLEACGLEVKAHPMLHQSNVDGSLGVAQDLTGML